MKITRIILASILVVAVLIWLGRFVTYSAEPITVKVVDASTGRPIENALVVADWAMQGGLEGGNSAGSMMVLETTTDASGTFHFQGWGPKWRPRGGFLTNARLKSLDPIIFIFKPKYVTETLQNGFENLEVVHHHMRTSQWNGKTVSLYPVKGATMMNAPKDDAANLKRFDDLLTWTLTGCDWRDIPLALKVEMQEESRLGNSSYTLYTTLLGNDGNEVKAGCGSPIAFFKAHGMLPPEGH